MWAEFKNTLNKMRGAILGWGIGLFLYTLLMAALYPMMVTEMGEQYLTMIEMVPAEFLAFFPNIDQFMSPIGFTDTYFFSLMVVVIPIFTIGQGAKLLVRDEEEGILDLVMSYPISRSQLFWARALAYLAGTILVLAISYVGWLLPDKTDAWTISAGELALAHLPLLAILLVFGAFTFMLSLMLPSFKAASGIAGALLVGNYLLSGISNMREELKSIFEFTPLHFYQGGLAINDFNITWFAGLMGTAILFLLIAWWRFDRRDIRVGGEAGWELPGWLKRKKA